tara:strand:- start:175 stop:504 length:330 start_codon:yes stop_codon:yes gene_type:complete
MLSIGQLDRQIKIQSPTFTQNNYGENTKTYSTLYTLWAHVDWKKSDRDEESQEQVQTTDVIFTIRNLGVDILSTYIVVYETKTYVIHGIKEVDGRERFLELETKLKDNN